MKENKPKGVSSFECLKNGHGLLYLEIKKILNYDCGWKHGKVDNVWSLPPIKTSSHKF